jgi:hypothetical protein
MSNLTELYALHRAGKLPGTDKRWLDVSRDLCKLARQVVEAGSRDLYGTPVELAIEDVGTALLQKFVACKLDHSGAGIEPLLRTAARNDMLSYYRRSRSPTASSFDGAEQTWEKEAERAEPTDDMFARARAFMPPFRFAEYPHVRDAVLAFFLTHWTYPGAGFLHPFGVHHSIRQPVYNAAVFDLNRAMIRICEPARAT